jgi:ABC-type multidrug transport system permease subunit
MYYLDPFTYLIGALLQPVIWDVEVSCKPDELAGIEIPQNATCGEYMKDFITLNAGYVVDPDSQSSCEYCAYTTGADYLRTMNISEAYYGWRDVSYPRDKPHIVSNH